MGITNKSCTVYFGQVGQRTFNRNIVGNSGGWLGKIRTIEDEFKWV
jgi:hypothetical protein